MSDFCAEIDLGGTAVKVVLADSSGNTLVEDSMPTQAHGGRDVVQRRIADFVELIGFTKV